jgi:cell division protease FtsH
MANRAILRDVDRAGALSLGTLGRRRGEMSERNQASVSAKESAFVRRGKEDVVKVRRRTRRRRIIRALLLLVPLDVWLFYRDITQRGLSLPHLPSGWEIWLPFVILAILLGGVMVLPFLFGRTPHLMVRPDHIEIGLDQVKGLDNQVDEIMRTLDVFMGYARFREVLGGNPRRGILFEGPPGTGKTFLAQAMAKHASVPFLFVSAPAFPSMWQGMTQVRIRNFFKSLRKAARKEGGAIGFIEEIDAIGTDRNAMSMDAAPGSLARTTSSFMGSGNSGMVNELLIQMQSFDQPPMLQRLRERFVQWMNGYMPDGAKLKMSKPKYHNILLIAATNRADSLDPALLRPGRFDRRLYFDFPSKSQRRDLVDFFLERKSHDDQLDDSSVRDRLAQETFGYTPVMIEHLLDESLLVALRDGREAIILSDVFDAKLTEEIGLRQHVTYTSDERNAIATHEAGHAVAAYLLGVTRRLEILSIIKRRNSLGLLAHSDLEERFTRSRTELEASIAIALAGMASEEIFLGESGTGPGSDLATATSIAALMVGSLGMGETLLSYEAVAEGMIGRTNLVGKVLGDPNTKQQVEALLNTQKEHVLEVLGANRDLVTSLRDALVERDELVGEEILDVIHDAIERRKILLMPDVSTTIHLD